MKQVAALAVMAACAVFDPATAQLVSNRAVYDVTLEHTTGADVVAAHGRLAMEFKDLCDGWSTQQRLIIDSVDASGASTRTDFFVTSWESKDGRKMRFDTGQTASGDSSSVQRGTAELEPDGSGHVELLGARRSVFRLPAGTEFPTAQVLGILGAAQKGAGSYNHRVFQGGTRSDVNFSTAVIGAPASAASRAADRKADRNGLLKRVPAWPAIISFYPLTARAETPDYEVGTRLYANGVNGSMSLIYPTYALKATLVRLDAIRSQC